MGGVAEILKTLPAVERVLQHPEVVTALQGGAPRSLVTDAVRDVLETLREKAKAGEPIDAAPDVVVEQVLALVQARQAPAIKRVINATGVVLHTNLGRAVLPGAAVEAMATAAGYCNLEYDLDSGARGYRHAPLVGLLRELTGAEDAVVVNNNAAAVLLVLTALCKGGEVVVSRGQLVEIGGAFRVPEVMAASGATLKEVGATNKTHPADYENAVGPETVALMKVHTSNFKVCGFTREVSLEELVGIGRAHNLLVIEDLGSGLLYTRGKLGGVDEPDVASALATGADVVTFSGDKLLGGPQAGIILGKKSAIEKIARHPLMRALRPDKVTLAALEATLALYRDQERARLKVPTLAMLTASPAQLKERAAELASMIAGAVGAAVAVDVVAEESEAGGGSLPVASFPTHVVAVSSETVGSATAEARLRQCAPPVIARVKEGAVLLDPRTLGDDEFAAVAQALKAAFAG